jgi:arylsulfatase A-like enzyme
MRAHATTVLPIAPLAMACACHRFDPDDESAAPDPGWGRAHTVVVITIDSLNTDMLFGGPEHWETAPRIMALFDEATVYRNAQAPRSVTAPALSSMLTGAYPMHHGLRDNAGHADVWVGLERTTLLERFQAAGYRTLGYSANQCYLLDPGTDQRACTWEGELKGDYTLRERDAMLVDQLDAALRELSPEEDIFLWLHLNNPHMPYEVVEEYYREFHPWTYEGDLLPQNESSLAAVTLGRRDYDEEDRLHLLATYASQIRETDDRVGQILDALTDIGRQDDAIIAFGADHGEEIGAHYDYFWHGCTFYSSGLEIPWVFRAPGRLPAGFYETQIGAVDVAPTLVDLAGAFPWDGPLDGRGLADQAVAQRADDEPVYFERSPNTAGLVWQGYRYALSSAAGYGACKPYIGSGVVYPNEQVELFDLAADPEEFHNLAGTGLAEEEEYEAMTCAWLLGSDWLNGFEEAASVLLDRCSQRTRGG